MDGALNDAGNRNAAVPDAAVSADEIAHLQTTLATLRADHEWYRVLLDESVRRSRLKIKVAPALPSGMQGTRPCGASDPEFVVQRGEIHHGGEKRLTGVRVLVAEDNIVNQLVMADALLTRRVRAD